MRAKITLTPRDGAWFYEVSAYGTHLIGGAGYASKAVAKRVAEEEARRLFEEAEGTETYDYEVRGQETRG